MTNSTFDAFTRQTASRISRRGSLLTLGGAGIAAALGEPLAAEAKPGSKKKARKKAKKKAQQKCRQQVPQCETALAQVGSPQFAFCCQFLGTCNATQFIQCIAN
jgi:hypothetical protein